MIKCNECGCKNSANASFGKNGITPIKAESDETEAVRKLCREYIVGANKLRKPPQLYSRIYDVFVSLQNRMPHVSKEQIETFIGLLLLPSEDECRKRLNEVSWNEIPSMFNGSESFTKPIHKTAMDCIRLVN